MDNSGQTKRPTSMPTAQRPVRLAQLVTLFGWLGLIGFGGGPAVLSLIREYVVERKRWLDDHGFVEAVALAQSLPGVIGTNTATYIGLRLRGWLGAGLAVVSFVFPSFIIIVGLTMVYAQTRHLPAVERAFFGLTPAMTGIIAATAIRLSRSTVKRSWHAVLAVTACAAATAFRHLVVQIILAAGAIGLLAARFQRAPGESHDDRATTSAPIPPHADRANPEAPSSDGKTRLHSILAPVVLWAVASSISLTLLALFLIFLKIGALTYGGGYVMVPLMEHDVVYRFRWVNARQFADGVALGQLTPGPIAITATFIGYFAAGLKGALVATVAIFLPSFVMTGIAGTYVNRFRESRWIQAALAGVAPAVTGLLMTGAIIIGQASIHSLSSGCIALAAGILFLALRLNPLYIMLGAGAVGLLVR